MLLLIVLFLSLLLESLLLLLFSLLLLIAVFLMHVVIVTVDVVATVDVVSGFIALLLMTLLLCYCCAWYSGFVAALVVLAWIEAALKWT